MVPPPSTTFQHLACLSMDWDIPEGSEGSSSASDGGGEQRLSPTQPALSTAQHVLPMHACMEMPAPRSAAAAAAAAAACAEPQPEA